MKTWYPLGYNVRPRRLQAIARESVEKHDGRLPDDEETLRSFKGIGAYTAGAVMSFAFGKRAAILDTNVARVLYRVFVARGERESSRRREAPVGDLPRGPAAPACLRFQSGADGLRRHRLQRAKTAVHDVPDDVEVPVVSVQSRA